MPCVRRRGKRKNIEIHLFYLDQMKGTLCRWRRNNNNKNRSKNIMAHVISEICISSNVISCTIRFYHFFSHSMFSLALPTLFVGLCWYCRRFLRKSRRRTIIVFMIYLKSKSPENGAKTETEQSMSVFYLANGESWAKRFFFLIKKMKIRLQRRGPPCLDRWTKLLPVTAWSK